MYKTLAGTIKEGITNISFAIILMSGFILFILFIEHCDNKSLQKHGGYNAQAKAEIIDIIIRKGFDKYRVRFKHGFGTVETSVHQKIEGLSEGDSIIIVFNHNYPETWAKMAEDQEH